MSIVETFWVIYKELAADPVVHSPVLLGPVLLFGASPWPFCCWLFIDLKYLP
jgi:hypothetical protein